jgi:hypothetical protein
MSDIAQTWCDENRNSAMASQEATLAKGFEEFQGDEEQARKPIFLMMREKSVFTIEG